MEAFYDNDMARRRLNNTICFYDGTPVFVRYYDGDMITTWNLGMVTGGAGVIHKYTDPKFTGDIPPLGYVNYQGHAYLVLRHIIRDQRSGLPLESINVEGNQDGRVYVQDMAYSASFRDMLMDVYPSMREAWKRVTEQGETSCAFSKTYAFDWEGNVLHRGRIIGKIKDGKMEYSPYLKKISFFMRDFGDKYESHIKEVTNGRT